MFTKLKSNYIIKLILLKQDEKDSDTKAYVAKNQSWSLIHCFHFLNLYSRTWSLVWLTLQPSTQCFHGRNWVFLHPGLPRTV